MNILNPNKKGFGAYTNGRNNIDKPLSVLNVGYISFGVVTFRKDFKSHRNKLPAFISVGNDIWCKNDKHHRLDGPAIVYNVIGPPNEYYINGRKFKKDRWLREVQRLKEEDR